MGTCTNLTCPGGCASPDRAAVCANQDCPEQGLRKTACHVDLPPAATPDSVDGGLIRCGHCGKACELREADAGAASPAGQ